MSEESKDTQSLDPYADNPDVVLREHVYDGIQEYDQKLPNWWLWTLYIFIILFLIYWVLYYQIGLFHSDRDRVDVEIEKIEAVKALRLQKLMGSLDDDVIWQMSRNGKIVDEGEATYTTVCSACHAPDLGGNKTGPQYVGLPLDDNEWKYGGKPLEIFKIVMDGSPDKTKGMAPWKDALGGEKVAKVVAFVLSKHPVPEGVKIDG